MTDFKRLGDAVWASPQITDADVAEAARQGFVMIVNNRPDGEVDDQPTGAQIEKAAKDSSLGYVSIPIGPAGFGQQQVDAMAEALDKAGGKVLAYCRSGTRSTFLWALARASRGDNPASLAQDALKAGYDIGPIMPLLETLAEKSAS